MYFNLDAITIRKARDKRVFWSTAGTRVIFVLARGEEFLVRYRRLRVENFKTNCSHICQSVCSAVRLLLSCASATERRRKILCHLSSVRCSMNDWGGRIPRGIRLKYTMTNESVGGIIRCFFFFYTTQNKRIRPHFILLIDSKNMMTGFRNDQLHASDRSLRRFNYRFYRINDDDEWKRRAPLF